MTVSKNKMATKMKIKAQMNNSYPVNTTPICKATVDTVVCSTTYKSAISLKRIQLLTWNFNNAYESLASTINLKRAAHA